MLFFNKIFGASSAVAKGCLRICLWMMLPVVLVATAVVPLYLYIFRVMSKFDILTKMKILDLKHYLEYN